jgi:hypothetical protein
VVHWTQVPPFKAISHTGVSFLLAQSLLALHVLSFDPFEPLSALSLSNRGYSQAVRPTRETAPRTRQKVIG